MQELLIKMLRWSTILAQESGKALSFVVLVRILHLLLGVVMPEMMSGAQIFLVPLHLQSRLGLRSMIAIRSFGRILGMHRMFLVAVTVWMIQTQSV